MKNSLIILKIQVHKRLILYFKKCIWIIHKMNYMILVMILLFDHLLTIIIYLKRERLIHMFIIKLDVPIFLVKNVENILRILLKMSIYYLFLLNIFLF